jgi:hypothetical protein
MSELSVPASLGRIVAGETVFEAPAGSSESRRTLDDGDNLVQAVLLAGGPGTWALRFVGIEDLRVVEGRAIVSGRHTVVVSLRGEPGERVVLVLRR